MIALLLPLFIGAAVLAAAMLGGRWFVRADPARLARIARRGGGLAMIAIGLLLVLRGLPSVGLSLAVAGMGRLGGSSGFAGRAGPSGFGRSRGADGGRGSGTAQKSSVRTAMLDATLDHETGEIDAVVHTGRFAGRQLSAMSKAEVLGLWVDCAGDTDSALVAEAYLDRRHPEWRRDVEGDRDGGARGAGGSGSGDRAGGPGAGATRSGPMTKQDAYKVLGLASGARPDNVRQRHRRLMKEAHPDQGGDTARAAEINEAKDVLLGRRRR